MITFEKESYEDEERFFQKVDRILTGDVRIRVKQTELSLAYADISKKNIFLNFEEIDELAKQKTNQRDETINFIGLAKGFNYHELAHQIFTKHNKKDLPPSYRGMLEILNCLEDGRIETLFSNRYPKTKNYFVNCFLKAIYKKRNELSPLMYIPTQSRQLLLPKKLIAYFEKAFLDEFGKKIKEEVNELIKAYLQSKNSKKQIEIAKRIFEITKGYDKTGESQEAVGLSNINSIFTGKKGYNKKDKEAIKELAKQLRQNPELAKELSEKAKRELEQRKKQRALSRKAEKDIEKKEEERKNKRDKEIEIWEKKRQKIYDWQKEVTERKKQGKKEETEKEKKLSKEIQQLKKDYNEARKETQEVTTEVENLATKEELLKKVFPSEELFDEIKTDEQELEGQIDAETEADIKAIYKEIGGSTQAGLGTEELTGGNSLQVETKHKNISRQIQNLIRLIKNDLRSGYVEKQRIGKVNIRRVMNANKTGDTKIFRKYKQNKLDKTRLGTVLLIDSSGSMNGEPFNKALQCSWVLSDALEKTHNEVCIIEFSYEHKIIKHFKQKGEFKQIICGGTYPVRALEETLNQIKKLNKVEKINNWVVFILTDGMWGGKVKSEEVIKTLNKAGIETILIYFSKTKKDIEDIDSHECKHKIGVTDIDDLSKVMKETIGKIEKNIRAKIIREGR